jgi:epoxyqueuosine reductase
MLKIGHSVTRPGRTLGDEPVNINVPEELERVPGVVTSPVDVDYWSREYPLETLFRNNSAEREWAWSIYNKETVDFLKMNNSLSKPIVEAAKDTGDIEPTVEPVAGKDVTQEIKAKARELGFGEVGITKMDLRYTFKAKREWVKFPHAICLALEQDYEPTQTIPSMWAEGPHYGTYRTMGALALELADYIRSLGYHAQVHSPLDNSGAYIPLLVEAGLGQLGANGQLLSPHFGSRARIMLITTEAIVTYDQPVDYGILTFCEICQVCVNRCPGRALMRDKVWWRGVQKHKLNYKRCRPVMTRYDACGVCMKVCPIQRYGMEAVLDHYTETGQVLGKGTHLLEGYSMRDLDYFGPGELPRFDSEFFHIPNGASEDLLFEDFKEKLKAGEVPDDPHGEVLLHEFKEQVVEFLKGPVDRLGNPVDEVEDTQAFRA